MAKPTNKTSYPNIEASEALSDKSSLNKAIKDCTKVSQYLCPARPSLRLFILLCNN